MDTVYDTYRYANGLYLPKMGFDIWLMYFCVLAQPSVIGLSIAGGYHEARKEGKSVKKTIKKHLICNEFVVGFFLFTLCAKDIWNQLMLWISY